VLEVNPNPQTVKDNVVSLCHPEWRACPAGREIERVGREVEGWGCLGLGVVETRLVGEETWLRDSGGWTSLSSSSKPAKSSRSTRYPNPHN
jgi:hypothetical protein